MAKGLRGLESSFEVSNLLFLHYKTPLLSSSFKKNILNAIILLYIHFKELQKGHCPHLKWSNSRKIKNMMLDIIWLPLETSPSFSPIFCALWAWAVWTISMGFLAYRLLVGFVHGGDQREGWIWNYLFPQFLHRKIEIYGYILWPKIPASAKMVSTGHIRLQYNLTHCILMTDAFICLFVIGLLMGIQFPALGCYILLTFL